MIYVIYIYYTYDLKHYMNNNITKKTYIKHYTMYTRLL